MSKYSLYRQSRHSSELKSYYPGTLVIVVFLLSDH
jgi:hypothetical protein